MAETKWYQQKNKDHAQDPDGATEVFFTATHDDTGHSTYKQVVATGKQIQTSTVEPQWFLDNYTTLEKVNPDS